MEHPIQNRTRYTLEIDGITVDVQDNDWTINYGGYPSQANSELTTTICLDTELSQTFIHKFRSNSIYNDEFKFIARTGQDMQVFTGKIICVTDLSVDMQYNTTVATFTIVFRESNTESVRDFGEKRYDIFGKQIKAI